MDPLTTYEVAKLRMAERHADAARARMARLDPSNTGGEDRESVWRRWSLRRLAGRISLANAGS